MYTGMVNLVARNVNFRQIFGLWQYSSKGGPTREVLFKQLLLYIRWECYCLGMCIDGYCQESLVSLYNDSICLSDIWHIC